MQQFAHPAFQLAVMLTKDRPTAEEIVQEAFTRAWQSQRVPREPDEFRRWIYRVVTNLAWDYHRRQRRWSVLRLVDHPRPTPEEEFERRVRDKEVMTALSSLGHREQEAIYLRFFDDASYDEVARTLGIKEATARVLVFRALRKLHAALEYGLTAETGEA